MTHPQKWLEVMDRVGPLENTKSGKRSSPKVPTTENEETPVPLILFLFLYETGDADSLL